MQGIGISCLFGKPGTQEESLQSVRRLEDHILSLGGELLDSLWTVEMTYKMKQKTKKTMGSEMRFGINTAAPFVGMKSKEGNEHPFTKQYCILSKNDRGTRAMVVQEMTDESALLPEGKLARVLNVEGEAGLAKISAASGMVTRLKATIEGHAYLLGDYIVRVGKCRKGAVYKGECLEVEYMPTSRLDGFAMILALLPSIDGKFLPTSDLGDARVVGTSPFFTAKHAAIQTTDLFNKVFV